MMNLVLVEFDLGKTEKEFMSMDAWRAAAAEFVATFLFTFVSCGAVVTSGWTEFANMSLDPSRIVLIAFAHGIMITVLVGAIGSISGGHINPAVSLAFAVCGRISLMRLVMYVAAQVLGAVLGAGLLKGALSDLQYGNLGVHGIGAGVSSGSAVIIETVLTFILIFVIFGSAGDPRGPGSIAPLLIGQAVTAAHLIGVPLTGPSLNPARSFGPVVWTGIWHNNWIHWIGPFLGAFIAAMVYVHVLRKGFRSLDAESIEGELELAVGKSTHEDEKFMP